MNFQTSVKTCLNKFIDFSGRASRAEYWWFFLFSLIASLVGSIVDAMLSITFGFEGLISLALLLPSLAVSVRRLKDTDRSGWWLLLVFIPIVGWLVLLYFFVQKGTAGENRFGADPLA